MFESAWFERFARKERISVAALWDAVERAEQGQIDADLGGADEDLQMLIDNGQFKEVVKDA